MKTKAPKNLFSLIVSLTLLSVVFTYNACSKDSFKALTAETGVSSSDSVSGAAGVISSAPSASLLTSEQILQSSLALTGIPSDGQITNEYSLRTSVLSSTFDLNQVTSPMWIGITNLNSVVCQKLVTKEVALPAASRTFFKSIDFSKPASQVTDVIFLDSATAFSTMAFGRNLHVEENTTLAAARAEFTSAIAPADASNVAQTRNLMMFLCVAMISSVESISL